jgi:hypothetical protein
VGRSSVSTVYWGTLCGEEKTFFRGYGIIERRFSKTSLNGVDRAQYSSAANPPPAPSSEEYSMYESPLILSLLMSGHAS